MGERLGGEENILKGMTWDDGPYQPRVVTVIPPERGERYEQCVASDINNACCEMDGLVGGFT